ncbi:MAG: hypothetical protein IJ856_05755 [Candidatus Methanomethylophilaceae archaeon]|nr:hypothetical protein [Candidatus Methanomethylophilaceae archaeon]
MDEIVELRCKFCGAPLNREQVESESPYVTCESCGTTQQRVDAKQYMEQMMGEIKSWISKAIPGGFTVAQTQNVDPIARHNIYLNNVKPMIDPEIKEFNLALNSLIAHSLIVLPYNTGTPPKANHTSQQAFEFNARLKSIEPLAVDNTHRQAIVDAENSSSAYALIVNNTNLLSKTTPGRFALMSKNFTEAADFLKSVKGLEPLVSRLNALAEVCEASDMVLNGDSLGCSVKAEKSVDDLMKAKKEILKSPRLAVMIRAVDMELAQCRTLQNISSSATTGESDESPLEVLNLLNKINSIKLPSIGDWGQVLSRKERSQELYDYIGMISDAKKGGTLMICRGSGDTLYPFWDVDLKYSFTTGAMFSKKSVEVTEDILIPATFVASASALENPRQGLTDIFAAAPESTILSKVQGKESSISGGTGIGALADSAAENQLGGRKVVVPLSTKLEATKLVEEYMKQCVKTHSKLKLGKPQVKRLIFIPCSYSDNGVTLPQEFSRTTPAVLSKIGKSATIVL